MKPLQKGSDCYT